MVNTVQIEPLLWLQLTGLISLALAAQFLVRKFRQPLLLGEILIGILVKFLSDLFLPAGVALFESALIGALAFLGAVFLLFTVGLESDLKDIYTARNAAVALGGVVLPWVGGFALAEWVFPELFQPQMLLDPATGESVCYYCTPASAFAAKVFVGSTLVATSIAVSAAVLHEMGRLKGDVAKAILGAAVVDDILGMIVLATSVHISRGDLGLTSILVPILLASAFVGLSITLGVRYLGRVVSAVQVRAGSLGLPHSGFLTALVITFLMAFASELAGLSPIIGAFMAGAIFSRLPAKDEIQGAAENLRAIFAPIFFISIGLLASVTAFTNPLYALFLVGVTVVAFASKIFGCALPARFMGLGAKRAWAVGVGMVPRGEVALIIALFAFSGGIIGPRVYTTMVVMAILTSLVPPVILKRLLRASAREDKPSGEDGGRATGGEQPRVASPPPFPPPPQAPPGF